MRPSLRRAALQRFALKMLQLVGALIALIAIAMPTQWFGVDALVWKGMLLGVALLAGVTPMLMGAKRRPRARATAPSACGEQASS